MLTVAFVVPPVAVLPLVVVVPPIVVAALPAAVVESPVAMLPLATDVLSVAIIVPRHRAACCRRHAACCTAAPTECRLLRLAAGSRLDGLTLPSSTCWLIVGLCFAFLCCFSKEMHTLFLHLNCRCRRRKLGGGTRLQCGAEAAEAAIP